MLLPLGRIITKNRSEIAQKAEVKYHKKQKIFGYVINNLYF